MKIYTVTNGKDFKKDFYNLSDAKKAMVEHNAKGYIQKVYSSGDWVNCGEINLGGRNSTLVQGATRQNIANY